MLPPCCRTSHTHATCSCVKPNEGIGGLLFCGMWQLVCCCADCCCIILSTNILLSLTLSNQKENMSQTVTLPLSLEHRICFSMFSNGSGSPIGFVNSWSQKRKSLLKLLWSGGKKNLGKFEKKNRTLYLGSDCQSISHTVYECLRIQNITSPTCYEYSVNLHYIYIQ